MENIVGADEQNVLFLEFLVIGSLGQSVQIAHALVIASTLGEVCQSGHPCGRDPPGW